MRKTCLTEESTISEEHLQEFARGKPTEQSTTAIIKKSGTRIKTVSSLAVDGNTSVESHECSRTTDTSNPWWMVDLEDVYLIKEFAITTADTNQTAGFKLLTVEVSRRADNSTGDMFNPQVCFEFKGKRLSKGTRHYFSCFKPVVGRYVKMSKYRTEKCRVSLCEVQVYGTATQRFQALQIRRGKKSGNRPLETIQTSNPVVCSAYCQRHLDCTSFNMADGGQECELMTDPWDNIDVNEETASGWTRFIVN